MDIYEKILYNLNIIKNNILNYNFNKLNFGFTKMILLKNNLNSEDLKGIPYYCENNNIPFIIKLFPKTHKNMDLLNIEIVYSTLFSNELIYNSPNFISIYDYSYLLSNKKKCLFKLNLKTDYTDILLYEFITEKDIDTFYYNKKNLDINVWKSIVFQVIYNLYLLQDKYKFIHNDLHPANILIDSIKNNNIINYNFNNDKFYVPSNGFIIKISDFEYSCIYNTKYTNIKNKSVYLSKIGYCKSYDLHSFLIGLLDLIELPEILLNFIKKLYPSKLIDKKYLDNGFLTHTLIKEFEKELDLLIPEKIIYHNFFKEYNTNNFINNNVFIFNYKTV